MEDEYLAQNLENLFSETVREDINLRFSSFSYLVIEEISERYRLVSFAEYYASVNF
jgi:hypothetical protein